MSKKDYWNAQPPVGRQAVRRCGRQPRAGPAPAGALPGRLPEPGRLQQGHAQPGRPGRHLPDGHPERGGHAGSRTARATTQADLLRLNMAIPPTTSSPSNLGLIGNDVAGYPNGRRVFDDVVTIALRGSGRGYAPARRQDIQPRRRRNGGHRRADLGAGRHHRPRDARATSPASRISGSPTRDSRRPEHRRRAIRRAPSRAHPVPLRVGSGAPGPLTMRRCSWGDRKGGPLISRSMRVCCPGRGPSPGGAL